jgi:hypothetical protein
LKKDKEQKGYKENCKGCSNHKNCKEIRAMTFEEQYEYIEDMATWFLQDIEPDIHQYLSSKVDEYFSLFVEAKSDKEEITEMFEKITDCTNLAVDLITYNMKNKMKDILEARLKNEIKESEGIKKVLPSLKDVKNTENYNPFDKKMQSGGVELDDGEEEPS